MALISGKVSRPGQRVRHNELNEQIESTFGSGVGWAVEWTPGFGEVVAITYEYDDSLKIDPKDLEAIISAHSVPANEKDDVQIAQESKTLEERLAALERAVFK